MKRLFNEALINFYFSESAYGIKYKLPSPKKET
jgi:hypothetical protein